MRMLERMTKRLFLRKKSIVRPDLVENPRAIVAVPDFVSQSSASKSHNVAKEIPKESKHEKSSKRHTDADTKHEDITKIREQHAKEQAAGELSRKAEIEKMEAEIRKLQRRRDDSDIEDEASKKKIKKSYLNDELDKYAKGKGLHKKGKKKDEGDVLAALNSFRGKLQSSKIVDEPEPNTDAAGGDGDVEEGEEMEVDNDTGFMSHALHFPKDNGEETMKAERDYEVIDPRERGAKAKEEERVRKRAALKAKGGHVSGGRYRR